jgi:hypothetical protein
MGNLKSRIKEGVRKFFVALKRNPQYIPLAALLVSFLVYSLNLTVISNTTNKLLGANMGLCSFITMLFSILSFVCMLSAFPKRQKPNVLMILLMMVMYGAVIYADYTYLNTIIAEVNHPTHPIVITPELSYISEAESLLRVHMVLVGITMVCVLLEPLFAKLLRKINTSIDVEDNGEIGNIELTEDN